MSKGEGKGKSSPLGRFVCEPHTKQVKGVDISRSELVRGALSQNLPPGQALSFAASYLTYLLLRALHISTIWLIFRMNCYKGMQHWHGGTGGLCYEPALTLSVPRAPLLDQL